MRKLTAAVAGIAFLLVSLLTGPAWAKEPARPELTMKQVFEQAVKHDNSLKATDAGAQKAWEVREDAAEDVDLNQSGDSIDPENASLDATLIQSDLSYRKAQKSKESLQDQIELDVFSKYTSVQMAEENLRASEKQVEKDFSALKIARASESVGLISAPELLAAEVKYKTTVKGRDVAAENVSKAYVSLNSLIGLWPEDRPVLLDKIEYQPLAVDNIDTEVSRALGSSNSIWQLEQQVDVEKRDLSYMTKVYDAEKYDIESAKSSVDAEKKAVEVETRTLYSDILNLEEQYDSALEALKIAEEDNRIAKVKYDIGMITKNDLINTESSLSDAQNKVCTLAYDHEIKKANFLMLTGESIIA